MAKLTWWSGLALVLVATVLGVGQWLGFVSGNASTSGQFALFALALAWLQRQTPGELLPAVTLAVQWLALSRLVPQFWGEPLPPMTIGVLNLAYLCVFILLGIVQARHKASKM